MFKLSELKKSPLYTAYFVVVVAASGTWFVTNSIIISPLRDELSIKEEKIQKYNKLLNSLKLRYDIPDSLITDVIITKDIVNNILSNSTEIIESDTLTEIKRLIVKRNKTSIVKYGKFAIQVSTSDVDNKGTADINVGYQIPFEDLPESLNFKLKPATSMTIVSDKDNHKLFSLWLISSDPEQKSILVEIKLARTFIEMLNAK